MRYEFRALPVASSKHPDDRSDGPIAASESANDAAAVETVLIVLREIQLSKLAEIFP